MTKAITTLLRPAADQNTLGTLAKSCCLSPVTLLGAEHRKVIEGEGNIWMARAEVLIQDCESATKVWLGLIETIQTVKREC
jgi:hypothetical protein